MSTPTRPLTLNENKDLRMIGILCKKHWILFP